MATIYSQVRLATNTNIVLGFALQPGVSVVDGVIINANDRVLIKAQSDRTQNGLYYLNSSGLFVRTSDFANLTTHESGGIVFVITRNAKRDLGIPFIYIWNPFGVVCCSLLSIPSRMCSWRVS